MASSDPTTIIPSTENLCQTPGVGELVAIPVDRLDAACLLVRAIVAMDDVDDTDTLVSEGEPYEALARRLQHLRSNLHDVADQARALVHSSAECKPT